MTGLVNVNGRKISTNPNHWKQACMNDFTLGASVSDIAQASGCSRLKVEAVIREALAQTCAIVRKQLAEIEALKPKPTDESPTAGEGAAVTEAVKPPETV